MKRIVVLISNAGTGSNLQAIIDAVKSGALKVKIQLVVSSSPNAYGLIRAKKNKIPTFILKKKDSGANILLKYNPDFIVLAGWIRVIPKTLIEKFHNRILNIHPGLIPDSKKKVVENPDGTRALWNKGKMTDDAI